MIRNKIYGYIFGILFSAAMVTGYQLETYDHLTLSSISGILVFIGLSLIVGTLAPFGWKYLDRIHDKRRGITSKQKIDNGSITDILSDNMPDKESLPYDPAIPLLGIRTEETRRERDTCTPMFIAALFIIARNGNNLDLHQQTNG